MNIEERLHTLGIELPEATPPAGNYSAWVRHGDLLYLSGVGGGPERTGQVGGGVTTEEAYQNARAAAINHLAAMKAALGHLDEVVRVIRVIGYVNAIVGYADHPKVVNGATDLFTEVFGEAGKPARAAVGVASLPFGVPVEIETMVAVRH
jgi:enamine deaminase RidA (YjgF/YER057c/UK114 family)